MVCSVETASKHYSQFGQDEWVAKLFRGKRNGYFIEMGAADGVFLSNTLFLEKKFGWTGLLVEPTRNFQRLVKNRPGCVSDNSCVASERKIVNLFEAYLLTDSSEDTIMSIVRDDLDIKDYKTINDGHDLVCERAYQVNAVPLEEILLKHSVPKVVDYFSLDVEGQEYEVLKNFPFQEYTFMCLGVECPTVELHELLEKKGYIYILRKGCDDMYVHRSLKSYLFLRIFIPVLFLRFLNLFKRAALKVKRIFDATVKKRNVRCGLSE